MRILLRLATSIAALEDRVAALETREITGPANSEYRSPAGRRGATASCRAYSHATAMSSCRGSPPAITTLKV
jgi:hypothetical protein